MNMENPHPVFQKDSSMIEHIHHYINLLYDGTVLSLLLDRNKKRYAAFCDEALQPFVSEEIRHPMAEALFYAFAAIHFSFINQNQTESELNISDIFHFLSGHSSIENAKFLLDLSEVVCNLYDDQRQTSENILRLKTFIDRNLDEDLSLATLSNRSFFNPAYLSRLFKQETGNNLSDYILRKRIEKAKEELVETQKSVQEISKLTGFNTPQYFSSTFKKQVGMSPQEYRHQNSKF